MLDNDYCESQYYGVIDSFSDVYPRCHSREAFQKAMEAVYFTCCLDGLMETWADIRLKDKWLSLLRTTAGEWYDKQRRQDKEDERRREEDERRQEEEEYRRYEDKRRREQEERRHSEEEERHREEEERRRKDAEERRREEEAKRLEEERLAKRKIQAEENLRKLSEMQAKVSAPQPDVVVETITCPQCGGQVRKTYKFCTSCGTPLLAVCPSCGKSVKSGSKFCTNCGTPLKKN
jgi:hypothetical protein